MSKIFCLFYSNERCTLLDSSAKIDQKLLDSTDSSLSQTLLFGNSCFNTSDNRIIINSASDYVLLFKDCLRYKTIFCYKVAVDV